MFRILSLDGGGIKGAFTASVLATLEQDTGKSVNGHFDLITGTSTGGIIALGLGLGIPAAEIRDFYADQGGTIFPTTGLVQRTAGFFRQIFGPKHSHETLRQALVGVFGDRRLGESKCRLVIPTYDAIAGRIFLLKTAHHERFKYDVDAPAVRSEEHTSELQSRLHLVCRLLLEKKKKKSKLSTQQQLVCHQLVETQTKKAQINYMANLYLSSIQGHPSFAREPHNERQQLNHPRI